MKTVEDDLKEFQKKENERLDAEREYKFSENFATIFLFIFIIIIFKY